VALLRNYLLLLLLFTRKKEKEEAKQTNKQTYKQTKLNLAKARKREEETKSKDSLL